MYISQWCLSYFVRTSSFQYSLHQSVLIQLVQGDRKPAAQVVQVLHHNFLPAHLEHDCLSGTDAWQGRGSAGGCMELGGEGEG
jgi:hypothetical protein